MTSREWTLIEFSGTWGGYVSLRSPVRIALPEGKSGLDLPTPQQIGERFGEGKYLVLSEHTGYNIVEVKAVAWGYA